MVIDPWVPVALLFTVQMVTTLILAVIVWRWAKRLDHMTFMLSMVCALLSTSGILPDPSTMKEKVKQAQRHQDSEQ